MISNKDFHRRDAGRWFWQGNGWAWTGIVIHIDVSDPG
jgi:hypothetical protein